MKRVTRIVCPDCGIPLETTIEIMARFKVKINKNQKVAYNKLVGWNKVEDSLQFVDCFGCKYEYEGTPEKFLELHPDSIKKEVEA